MLLRSLLPWLVPLLRTFAALMAIVGIDARATDNPTCVRPGPECSEWIAVPGTTLRNRVFRTHTLERALDRRIGRASCRERVSKQV